MSKMRRYSGSLVEQQGRMSFVVISWARGQMPAMLGSFACFRMLTLIVASSQCYDTSVISDCALCNTHQRSIWTRAAHNQLGLYYLRAWSKMRARQSWLLNEDGGYVQNMGTHRLSHKTYVVRGFTNAAMFMNHKITLQKCLVDQGRQNVFTDLLKHKTWYLYWDMYAEYSEMLTT